MKEGILVLWKRFPLQHNTKDVASHRRITEQNESPPCGGQRMWDCMCQHVRTATGPLQPALHRTATAQYSSTPPKHHRQRSAQPLHRTQALRLYIKLVSSSEQLPITIMTQIVKRKTKEKLSAPYCNLEHTYRKNKTSDYKLFLWQKNYI